MSRVSGGVRLPSDFEGWDRKVEDDYHQILRHSNLSPTLALDLAWAIDASQAKGGTNAPVPSVKEALAGVRLLVARTGMSSRQAIELTREHVRWETMADVADMYNRIRTATGWNHELVSDAVSDVKTTGLPMHAYTGHAKWMREKLKLEGTDLYLMCVASGSGTTHKAVGDYHFAKRSGFSKSAAISIVLDANGYGDPQDVRTTVERARRVAKKQDVTLDQAAEWGDEAKAYRDTPAHLRSIVSRIEEWEHPDVNRPAAARRARTLMKQTGLDANRATELVLSKLDNPANSIRRVRERTRMTTRQAADVFLDMRRGGVAPSADHVISRYQWWDRNSSATDRALPTLTALEFDLEVTRRDSLAIFEYESRLLRRHDELAADVAVARAGELYDSRTATS